MRSGERRGGVITLEHAVTVRTREGAVNGEEQTTGSRADLVGGEWTSAYASEECLAVGLVSWPTNGNVWTDECP